MKASALTPPIFSPTTGLQKSDQSRENLREAARQFESVFAQMMLKSMRSASLGDDLMGDGGLYRDLHDSEMAKALSAGRGLGIAELMVRQLQGQDGAAPDSSTLRMPSRSLPVAPVHHSGRPVQSYDSPQAFVDAIRPYAEEAANQLGVPVEFIMAQAALESAWGQQPADGTGNLFGIKADRSWKGASSLQSTQEFSGGAFHHEQAAFRRYESTAESFADYVRFLKDNPRYSQALDHGGDGERFVRGLQQAGYATDPRYAEKIIRISRSQAIQSGSRGGES